MGNRMRLKVRIEAEKVVEIPDYWDFSIENITEVLKRDAQKNLNIYMNKDNTTVSVEEVF